MYGFGVPDWWWVKPCLMWLRDWRRRANDWLRENVYT